jgi:hypothetical protein
MHLAAGNTSLQQGLFNIQQPHRDHMIFETLSDGILVDDAKTLSVHWQLKMSAYGPKCLVSRFTQLGAQIVSIQKPDLL